MYFHSSRSSGRQIPALAASGNNVYVVWEDTISGPGVNEDILYRESTNGGATFGSNINLSNSAAESEFPAIAAFDNLT
jgi:hypothetical protein